MEPVAGRSIDLSVGGICVETLSRLDDEGDPMVLINLPDGSTVACGAITVATEEIEDGWRYRLAIHDLTARDTERIAALTGR
jgi:hypothetical protein